MHFSQLEYCCFHYSPVKHSSGGGGSGGGVEVGGGVEGDSEDLE